VRNEQRLDALLELPDGLFETRDLPTRFRGQLVVVNGNELARLRELALVFLKSRCQLYQRQQPPVFATQLGKAPGVLDCAGIRKRRLDLARPVERLVQSMAETQLSFLYF
jgi:hypothetical protein